MEKVVISLGGSILIPNETDDGYLSNLAKLLGDLSLSRKIFAVTGGGRISRFYIAMGRALRARARPVPRPPGARAPSGGGGGPGARPRTPRGPPLPPCSG